MVIYVIFFFLQRVPQNEDSFSSEDHLLPGRNSRASISQCSSTTTFLTGSSDSTAINIDKYYQYNKCRDSKMSANAQKELNILMTASQGLELTTGEEDLKKVTVEEPSIQDASCTITESQNINGEVTAKAQSPKSQIRWGPQVSSHFPLFLSLFSFINL